MSCQTFIQSHHYTFVCGEKTALGDVGFDATALVFIEQQPINWWYLKANRLRFSRPSFTFESFSFIPPFGCNPFTQPAIVDGLAFIDHDNLSQPIEIPRADAATTFAHLQCRNSELLFGFGCPSPPVTPPPLTQGAIDIVTHNTFTDIIPNVPFWDLTGYIRSGIFPSSGIFPDGAPAGQAALCSNSVACPADSPIIECPVWEGGYDVVPLGGVFSEFPAPLLTTPRTEDGTYVIEMDAADVTTPSPDTNVLSQLDMERNKIVGMTTGGGLGNRIASLIGFSDMDLSRVGFRIHDTPFDSAGQTVTFQDSTKVDQVTAPVKIADYPLEEDLPFDDADPVAMVMESGTIGSIREYLYQHLLERGVPLVDANIMLTAARARLTGAIGGAGSNFADSSYPKYGFEYSGGLKTFKESFTDNRIEKVSTDKKIQGYWLGASAKRESVTTIRTKPNADNLKGSQIGAVVDQDWESTTIV